MTITYCFACMAPKHKSGVCPSCKMDDSHLPSSANALPPGTILADRYLVGRVLGVGGFGITYLGLELNLGLKIAIKEYMPSGMASRRINEQTVHVFGGETEGHYASGLNSFFDEARTLVAFHDHPGIVTVRDIFKQHNTAYIIMDYLDGGTLKDYLARKQRLSWEETQSVFTHVLDALREVHAKGLLHRDISPDNIFITRTGQIKLIDFGACRQVIGEVSKSLSVILKPGYAPPEQYFSKGKQGPWTDVYAVAASIYVALTGSLPPESMERLDEDSLSFPSRLGVVIPPGAEQALVKGLAIKSADRYQTIAEFQEALLSSTATAQPRQSQAQTDEQQPSPNPNKKVRLALECGNYFQFGKYAGEPIIWRLIHIDEEGNLMLLSDRVICLKAFDAAGPYHAGALKKGGFFTEMKNIFKGFEKNDPQQFGRNYYKQSNLRQWLNSDRQQVDWIQNRPSAENVHGGSLAYDQEKGFLADGNFTAQERGMIKPFTYEVLLPDSLKDIRDGGNQSMKPTDDILTVSLNYPQYWHQIVTDQVFLLPIHDFYELMTSDQLIEQNIVYARLTKHAVEQANALSEETCSENDTYSYWLNGPFVPDESFVYAFTGVDDEGAIEFVYGHASNGAVGVRPALLIDRSKLKFRFVKEGIVSKGTQDDPHILVG